MRLETTGSNCQIVHPDDGEHSATIFLFHGLGDTSDGWISSAVEWHKTLPHIKFIVPSAEPMPITMNAGYRMPGWFDIVDLQEGLEKNCGGIEESRQLILSMMNDENQLGIPYNRMMLAGFSQGGCMSLFTGLQMEDESKKIAGILCMSGCMPAPDKFKLSAGFEDVPVLHCHGKVDPVVRHEWAVKTKSVLESEMAFKTYTLKSYDDLPHSINNAVIQDAQEFISAHIPFDASLALKPKDPSEMSVKELKAAIVRAGLSNKARGFSEKKEFVDLLKTHYAGEA
jgi:lysophospholipase II